MRQQGAVEYFDDDSFGANSRHADSPGNCDYEFGERGLGGGRVRESLGGCARLWDSGLFRIARETGGQVFNAALMAMDTVLEKLGGLMRVRYTNITSLRATLRW